jgi:hypothetical protein
MGSKIVGALAALTITGSVAWAGMTGPPHSKPPKGPGYGYHGGKVTICHVTRSRHKRNRYVTIRVSQRAGAPAPWGQARRMPQAPIAGN